ncbi:MAG: hypothetical protein ACREM1_07185, partial [Longimicrobiales bacterium]
ADDNRVVDDLLDPTDTAAIGEPVGIEPFRTLPFRYLTPDAAAEGTWVLRPIYKSNGLRWVDGEFRGALFLALEDSSRRTRSDSLGVPIRFQLISEADRIEPDQLTLQHTNLPLQRVELAASRPSDSLRIHIIPEFDIRGEDVWVPVEPTLVVETSPSRIQGWGVGTARVTVRVLGASGRVPSAVTLWSSAGELDTTTIALGDAGVGATRIRSSGTGAATLRASAAGFGEAPATIEFEWPILFIIASLAGGVFGGVASAVQGRRTGRADAPKPGWRAPAVKGLFAGVLAAAAWYALGVNLLELDVGVPRFNELAVFAFAALAGFFGIPRIRRQA